MTNNLPRRWPHFDPGWYVEFSWATFGPDTEDNTRSLCRRRPHSEGQVFFVPEPTAIEVLQVANGIGDP